MTQSREVQVNNLKASLFLYSIFIIFLGAAFWFVPGTVAEFFGISAEPDANGLIFSFLGSAYISVAYLFAVAGFNPLLNVNIIRFAVLWSALQLLACLYSIGAGYVTWHYVLALVIINAIFFFAFLIFYPWRRARE
jgi:hypothetical protein